MSRTRPTDYSAKVNIIKCPDDGTPLKGPARPPHLSLDRIVFTCPRVSDFRFVEGQAVEVREP